MKNKLTDANVLANAGFAAMKGSRWKKQVNDFNWNFFENIAILQNELKNETYKTSKTSEFLLNERGKTRPITGLQVRDRVVRHAICDAEFLPKIRPKLIYNNGASQTNKGVDFQRRNFMRDLYRFYKENGSNEGYILLIDFSKYYDNIVHEVAKKQILELYDGKCDWEWLLDHIFDTYKVDVSFLSDTEYGEILANKRKIDNVNFRLTHKKHERTGKKLVGKSVQVGDQLAQCIGIYYPHCIDNYVKTVRGAKYYGRYMDDCYIIGRDKSKLRDILSGVKENAKKLGIFINEKKTHLFKLSHRFLFLQHYYFIQENGKVVKIINSKSVTRIRRKIGRLRNTIAAGRTTLEAIANMFYSWLMGRRRTLSKLQKHNLFNIYNNLLEGI